MTDKSAIELYEQDARFRSQVASAVARAMDEAREFMDEDNLSMRDIHVVATRAAVQALKDAFDGNSELNATRIERDHYKKLTEYALLMSPAAPLVLTR